MIYLTFSYMYNQEYYIIKILCNLLHTPQYAIIRSVIDTALKKNANVLNMLSLV